MRIGLISDVHSNLSALEAVLADMGNVDVLICAGDVVGYYADPNEVCELLRQKGAWTIRGNHDAYVLGILAPEPEHADAYRTDWTRQMLGPENRSWLASLPIELSFRWNGNAVRIRHASPWDEETYLYKDSPRLNDIVLAEDEILILGHTHHPMESICGNGKLVNPGSVGQPRDWRPSASYAILDEGSGAVEFRRVAYDVKALQCRLEANGWPKAMIDILSRCRD